MIEYTVANPIPFKGVVECVINDEKVHLTKEDLALSNTKIKNWFMQQNKGLAVVLIASYIGVLSFVIGMIIVKKWFSIKNTVTTINTSVSTITKQLAEAISLLCYAKIRVHIDRVKHPLVNNQSGAGRQSSMGYRHAIPPCSCPIIDEGHQIYYPNILSTTKLFQYAFTQSEVIEVSHAIPACNNIDKLSQHAVVKS